MDIHHAMIVRNTPERLYQALTHAHDLEIWMDAPVIATPEIGSVLEFQYDQGQRALRMEATHLEANKNVSWLILQLMWPASGMDQFVIWTLMPYESSTAIDFRMTGWSQNNDVYASVSYKWASFMMRLKIYMGDVREIASLLPIGGNK